MDTALLMVIAMLVAPALNAARTLFVDPDIWWHLADAQLITSTHHMIWTDPYSFTAVGQRWIDWEWLSEIPYLFSYNGLGLRGIYLLTWLVLCGNVLFVYWRGYRKGQSMNAALISSVVAFVLMTVNSGPRMIEFAYLAMSAEMAIFEAAERGNKRLVWLLPPLFSLWINLHGTWLIGLCLLGLYILCGLFSLKVGAFEQQAFSASDRNRLLAVLGLSVAALLVNPYGWHLMWSPFDMMLNQKLSVATISEWQPLTLSSFEGKGAVVAIALMVIANLVSSRKWTIFEIAVIFFAWHTAVSHHRFTYLAAVLTTPMLAADLKRAFLPEADEKTIPAMNFLITGVAICVIVVMFPSEASLKKMVGMMFPVDAIAKIQPTWRTFNLDYVGGMMALQQKPSFMDSRYDSFEHIGVMADYRSISQARDAPALMEKYHVDHALVKDDMPITDLLEHTPGWRIMMMEKAWEGNYLLFERTSTAATR